MSTRTFTKGIALGFIIALCTILVLIGVPLAFVADPWWLYALVVLEGVTIPTALIYVLVTEE